MPGRLQIKLEMDRDAKRAFQMVREWPTRWKNFKSELVYEMADYVYEGVSKKIPSAAEFKSYRKALRVSQITGLPSDTVGYAVEARANDKEMESASRVIVYVRAKKAMPGTRNRAEVLERFNPWTLDTLPFMPTKDEAVLVRRKVRIKQVAEVARDKRATKSQWMPALNKMGVRASQLKGKIQKALSGKAPEFAPRAIGLEFPDVTRTTKTAGPPPWRHTLIDFTRHELPRFMQKRPELARWVTDPSSKDWLSPTRPKSKLQANKLKAFDRFQKLVGPQLATKGEG